MKRFLSFLLMFILIFSVPAYASATPSNVDHVENVDYSGIEYEPVNKQEVGFFSESVSHYAAGALATQITSSLTNAWSGSNASSSYVYYINNDLNKQIFSSKSIASDGSVTINWQENVPKWSRSAYISLKLPKRLCPSVSGNYCLEVSMYSATTLDFFTELYANSYALPPTSNVAGDKQRAFSQGELQNSNSYVDPVRGTATTNLYTNCTVTTGTDGSFYFKIPNVAIHSTLNYLYFMLPLHVTFKASNPIVMQWNVRWTPATSERVNWDTAHFEMDGNAQNDKTDNRLKDIYDSVGSIGSGITKVEQAVTTGLNTVGQNIQATTQAIQKIPAQIASNMEPHFSEVIEQLHHITDQLHAFWDQYVNFTIEMEHPWYQNWYTQILDAIGNVHVDINADFTSLISKIQNEFTGLKTNLNENFTNLTESLENAWEPNEANQVLENIRDPLAKLESSEGELSAFVDENLGGEIFDDDFRFGEHPNGTWSLTAYIYALEDIAYCLTGFLVAMENFGAVIHVSFLISIVMLVIGWYRFKGA